MSLLRETWLGGKDKAHDEKGEKKATEKAAGGSWASCACASAGPGDVCQDFRNHGSEVGELDGRVLMVGQIAGR